MPSTEQNKTSQKISPRNARFLLFFAMFVLILPTLLLLIGLFPEQQSGENRRLSARPVLNWSNLDTFPACYEAYYRDHFAGRSTLIFFGNWLRFTLFQSTRALQVPNTLNEDNAALIIRGSQGCLYFGMKNILSDLRGDIPLFPRQLDKIKRNLRQNQAWLARQGIAFFVLIAPNKHSIYPEHLPAAHAMSKNLRRIDQLMSLLQDDPTLPLIDGRQPLLAAKVRRPDLLLYPNTDSHWNARGAYVIYRSIFSRMARLYPQLEPLSEDDFIITTSPAKGGDMAGTLSLAEVMTESQLEYKQRMGPIAKSGQKREYYLKEKSLKIDAWECDNPSLPKLLVFHDCFFRQLIPFFAPHFRRSVFLWNNRLASCVVAAEKPDIVILEIAERNIAFLTEERFE